jgi:hypothetical protein
MADDCMCTRSIDPRPRAECPVHALQARPVYDNDSFWWSAPMRENYIGLDRGPEPSTASALAEARAYSTARRREAVDARPRRARL